MILAVRTVERVVVVGLEAVWVMVTVIFITVRMDEWRAMRSLLDNDLAIIATANAAHRHSPNVRPPDHRASVLPLSIIPLLSHLIHTGGRLRPFDTISTAGCSTIGRLTRRSVPPEKRME